MTGSTAAHDSVSAHLIRRGAILACRTAWVCMRRFSAWGYDVERLCSGREKGEGIREEGGRRGRGGNGEGEGSGVREKATPKVRGAAGDIYGDDVMNAKLHTSTQCDKRIRSRAAGCGWSLGWETVVRVG